MSDGKSRVLVVDDEPSIAKIVKKQLEVAGYDVAVAADGELGWTKARDETPDVIILDVMLPKLNGYEVCGRLKQDERLRRIPVLMLTAKAQRQDQSEGLRCGADAYLIKPFQLEELLEQVRTLLARAAAPSSQAAPDRIGGGAGA